MAYCNITPILTSAFFLCASCGGDGIDDEPIVGEAEIRVLHYDYEFDLESRRAIATLTLKVESPGDCFSIPMRSQGLDESSIDDEPTVSAQYDGMIAHLCGIGWPTGTEIRFKTSTTVALETWENSQVGYSVTEDIEGNPFTYLVSWVGGCDRFGPCDSQASSFASYRFVIDHPPDHEVLCSGTLTVGDSQTICEFPYEGGPTYSSFGFAASPSWTTVDLGDWGGIAVTLYDMPTSNLAAKLDVDEHKDFTAWMVETFGPYPYGNELRFAVGPTYWNGFEHPGNILLNDRLKTSSINSAFANPLAHTTSHEIAHQWAGDETTLADTYDFVWKEAMAEYLVYVHKDENISESRAARTVNAWKTFSRSSEFYLVPDEQPPLLTYYGDVYGPGPMILFRQLEAIFTRQDVMEALASVLGKQRAISIADVQEALEDATGADLTNYFEAWVYGQGVPSWPRFNVTTEAVTGGTQVTVAQIDSDKELFGCAFNVTLAGAVEGEEQAVRVNLGADGMAMWTEVVDTGFEVVSFRFDKDRECLGTLSTVAPIQLGPKINPFVAPSFR